ncbi:RNA polymerase sigma factor [Nocardioides sp. MH1]|uniref:RNA polymerase sigma factor n=1 Tax=Nocardioides sp. MH1 TaxID=3242490 RepID=UPI0035202CDC
MTDDDLAGRLRSGDPEAMGEIYDRYADRIYGFCFRRTASWSLAEDAMAAVFLEVWRVRRRVETYGGELLPWLYGVAANVCRNSLRGQRRQVALRAKLHAVDGDASVADPADRVAARVDDERRMADLLHAVALLGERDRQILMLVAWDGLTYQQAAELLGVPVGTVRSRLSRSRARLAELMRPDDERPE